MIAVEDVVALWRERAAAQHIIYEQMRQVKAVYQAEFALPLPELDRNEKAAVANLLRSGIDSTAQRITSTMPDVQCPPEKPGFKNSEANSDTRRRAILGWWEANDMHTVMARRARHFVGYARSPVIIRPDRKKGIPRWEVRDPLGCYPNPTARLDSCEPRNVIFVIRRPLSWLQRHYPLPTMMLNQGNRPRPDDMYDILEYLDHDETVLVAVGQAQSPNERWSQVTGAEQVELERAPNLAGICLAVIPGRVTLGDTVGQFDGLIPMFYKQARLDALEYIAIEQGVFPKQWLVGNPGETPKVVAMADGRKGIIGVVKGGQIHDESLNPGYKTSQAIDRLASEQRLEGNVPAEMQGVSGTNIRTGRRGDEVLANGIDFGIQEAQRAFEMSLQAENRRGIAVTKAWFGKQPHSFYVSWRGARGPVDYLPETLFGTDHNIVQYALAGSDLNGQVVRMGQKLGAGLISKDTARKMDPEIDDADHETQQIIAEQVEQAFLQGLAQQMMSGAMNPVDAASFVKYVKVQDMDPIEAFEKVQAEAQARQATSGPPGTPEAPVPPGAPEAQPGVAAGPASAQAGVAVAPPAPAQQNLQSVLSMAGQAQGMMQRAG